MMAAADTIIPYCGAPPLPSLLWSRWNFDPVLIAILGAIYAAYVIGDLRLARSAPERRNGRELITFSAGWLLLSAALVSPLCALSVALFSARVGQHMLIAVTALPLIALSRPLARIAALLPGLQQFPAGGIFKALSNKASAGILFALFLWVWHTPGFYTATFNSDGVYWLMHLTMIGSAFLLWHGLLVRGLDQPLAALGLGFATTLQMGLLGALLTVAGRPLFREHLLTAGDWALTPLEDQQIGGLIMWVPGCSVLVVAAIAVLAQFMRSLERREPSLAIQS